MNGTIENINTFSQKDHFSNENWLKRGLNISEEEVVNSMKILIQDFSLQVLKNFKQNPETDNFREKFINQINGLNLNNFDTEEREWIIDLICNLADITGIQLSSLSYSLNSLMYGPKFANFMANQKDRETKFVQAYKVENECDSCGINLKCSVKEVGKSKGEIGIAKCWNCSNYSLFYIPEETSFLTSYNFYPVEIRENTTKITEELRTKIEELGK